jgi:hypothetical protein
MNNGNPRVTGGMEEMKASARYVMIVEWSEEDQCYVGSSPGLFYGGCHGEDEMKVPVDAQKAARPWAARDAESVMLRLEAGIS